ncbi:hypothetical protein [Luteolibacter luteus]|uniref:Uncharacterized protein n=1 Tax=Luteolibacter luteus TaxID=2728835 RepID=A0A858RPR7_9BACT|nr:hypothetical protein [Luteolibacter luteus]QJE99027.1 hypothetical protein HHL09_25685 [Luteolibacter luteus]
MTTRAAKQWRRKYLREGAWFGGAFVILSCTGAYLGDWRVVGAGGAVALFGFIFQRRMFRRWNCEECGSPLQRESKDGSAVVFHCERCGIVWDTKLHQDLS